MPETPLFDLLDGLEFWGPAPLHRPVRHLRARIRSGAISRDRYEAARAATRERASGGGNLRANGVCGDTTAKAVEVLWLLDAAIAATTDETKNLDDLLRLLAADNQKFTTERLQELTEGLTGASFNAFFNRRVSTRGY